MRKLLHMKLWWCTWWYPIWAWFSVWGRLKRWVGYGARGVWALVLSTGCLDFTCSGLWNAKTRGSCCMGQGWKGQKDVPSSAKAAILGGRTGTCCWEVGDEGAGKKPKSCDFWNLRPCDLSGQYLPHDTWVVLSISKHQSHCWRENTTGKETRGNVFLYCVREQREMWMLSSTEEGKRLLGHLNPETGRPCSV